MDIVAAATKRPRTVADQRLAFLVEDLVPGFREPFAVLLRLTLQFFHDARSEL